MEEETEIGVLKGFLTTMSISKSKRFLVPSIKLGVKLYWCVSGYLNTGAILPQRVLTMSLYRAV